MRWTVKVVAEAEAGQAVEHEIASVERGDWITPATLGLSLAEGKAVLAAIQMRLVGDQVKRHGEVACCCQSCGRAGAQGPLSVDVSVGLRPRPDARAAVSRVPVPARGTDDGAGALHAPRAHRAGAAVLHGKAGSAHAVPHRRHGADGGVAALIDGPCEYRPQPHAACRQATAALPGCPRAVTSGERMSSFLTAGAESSTPARPGRDGSDPKCRRQGHRFAFVRRGRAAGAA